jgi:hypothetical protein
MKEIPALYSADAAAGVRRETTRWAPAFDQQENP